MRVARALALPLAWDCSFWIVSGGTFDLVVGAVGVARLHDFAPVVKETECSRTPSYADQPFGDHRGADVFRADDFVPEHHQTPNNIPEVIGVIDHLAPTIWDAKVRPALWPNIT